MTNVNAFAVILAGGRGKRFWPLSRANHPKQLLPIVGGQPMIRQTIDRIQTLIPYSRMLIITSSDCIDQIRAIAPEIPEGNVLAEPAGKNTAPAIAWAAEMIFRKDNDSAMIVLASDHVIHDTSAFCEITGQALQIAAESRQLVTLGISPTYPETGYGYIRKGDQLAINASQECYKVQKFVEKPDKAKAMEYVVSGEYLWNSGMFIFLSGVIREEMRRYQPDIVTGIEKMLDEKSDLEIVSKIYNNLPSVSIDYAVMEKSSKVITVPLKIAWSDVGSWAALYDHLQPAENGNRFTGDPVLHDCKNTLVISANRLIAACGLEDIVIVDTEDALLVCKKDQAQKVGEITDILSKTDRWKKYV